MKLRHLQEFQLKKLKLTLFCVVVSFGAKSPSLLSQERQITSKKPSTSKSRPAASKATSPPSSVKSTKKTSTSKKVASHSRKSRRPVIRGQRTIETTRVLEIQNALAAAGYYKEQPSGQWDDSTSKAMSAYQQDNGFRTTGKPDALSLKKLGL